MSFPARNEVFSPHWDPTKKRKKTPTEKIQLQPGHAQIFQGLTFHYLPNNDKNPVRRRRINKAIEYGAVWAREWHEDVTHLIVDKHLRLSDVKKALGDDKYSKPGLNIVYDNYPPECVESRTLLLSDQVRFRVIDDNLPQQGESKGNEVQDIATKAAEIGNGGNGREPGTETCKRIEASDVVSSIFQDDRQAITEDNPRQNDEPDELDEMIAEARQTAGLPLDSDDEDAQPIEFSGNSSSEDDGRRMRPTKRPRSNALQLGVAKKDATFACMHKNDSNVLVGNPNIHTINMLEKMATYYDRIGDQWRTLAYRKGISALKKEQGHISARDQAIRIVGIGKRLALKIEEIATTDRLRQLDSAMLNPNDQLLQLFMGIHQVGLPTASMWIAQGHKSLKDLLLRKDLTKNQRIGIEHYEDFHTRIPREEVTRCANMVGLLCTAADSAMTTVVGGSYRRGAADCGDIDLIITKRDASLDNIRNIMIDTVIPKLFREGFLKAGLATSKSGRAGSKWQGACTLAPSPVWRRIDFLFVPWDEFGAALIYFTGNDIFNRSIRLLASKKGMRLNQHGLFGNVMRGAKRQRVTEGKLLEGRSEGRIFDILGVPWRPPEHRIC